LGEDGRKAGVNILSPPTEGGVDDVDDASDSGH
jgi:hypothetical protein